MTQNSKADVAAHVGSSVLGHDRKLFNRKLLGHLQGTILQWSGQGLLFNVCRKPTNICSYIYFYSNHSINVKIATFSGTFLRAFRVCSEVFLEDEIYFIFDIGKKHKYPLDILGKAYNNAPKTFNSHTAREPFNLNILVSPFHENFVKLVHVFKMY